MLITLFVHIVAGGLALVAGYVALFATKGATLHRRSGLLFVYAMLVMSLGGLLIAAVKGTAPAINIPAALLTAYLVITAFTAVRPPAAGARYLTIAGLVVVTGVAVASLAFGVEAIALGGRRNGMPAFPFLMFGTVGALAAIGDIKMIGSGSIAGSARLVRHLWRMCFALFIAALSFFLGQADVIPKPLRIAPLLALPVLVVLVTMLYWLWRVRGWRGVRRGAGIIWPRHDGIRDLEAS